MFRNRVTFSLGRAGRGHAAADTGNPERHSFLHTGGYPTPTLSYGVVPVVTSNEPFLQKGRLNQQRQRRQQQRHHHFFSTVATAAQPESHSSSTVDPDDLDEETDTQTEKDKREMARKQQRQQQEPRSLLKSSDFQTQTVEKTKPHKMARLQQLRELLRTEDSVLQQRQQTLRNKPFLTPFTNDSSFRVRHKCGSKSDATTAAAAAAAPNSSNGNNSNTTTTGASSLHVLTENTTTSPSPPPPPVSSSPLSSLKLHHYHHHHQHHHHHQQQQQQQEQQQQPENENEAMIIDSYQRKHTYLRVSLVERCNLRCQYCMPPEGVPLQPSDKLLTRDEIVRLVHLFAMAGVDKVRLTGGEPLLRKDLSDIISSISSIPTIQSVGITTNGLTLSRQLPHLIEAGMTHVNISLDTLREDRFAEITRRRGLSNVLRSIQDAVMAFHPSTNKGRVKVNCVVMNGFNSDELRDFVQLTEDTHLDVRFIEWMPFNDNGWNANRFFSYKDMMKCIQQQQQPQGDDGRLGSDSGANSSSTAQLVRLVDGPNDTTKWWGMPGYKGRIGFITSMSNHFCGTCNRLRITADGQLKVCLFGNREVSLRDAMRSGVSDEELAGIIGAAVKRKTFALGGHGNAQGIADANDNRPMTLIGG